MVGSVRIVLTILTVILKTLNYSTLQLSRLKECKFTFLSFLAVSEYKPPGHKNLICSPLYLPGDIEKIQACKLYFTPCQSKNNTAGHIR